ncbi:hypothetical protein L7F22_020967 [Adiantum nelumboides]|nr:hypothetical protein [Adiantum nelumboides]
MASTSSSASPKSKPRDVIISVNDVSSEEESRAKYGRDKYKILTATLREDEGGSPLVIENDNHVTLSSATPMQNNLWREVSGDYLQDLDSSTDKNAIEQRKKREQARLRPQSFDFGVSRDPPTKLIENFLQHQAATGDLCLDMDMNMMEKIPAAAIAKDVSTLPHVVEYSQLAEGNQQMNMATLHPLINVAPSGSGAVNFQQGKQQMMSTTRCPNEPTVACKEAVIGKLNPSESDKMRMFDDGGNGSHSGSEDESEIKRPSARPSLNRLQTSSRLADRPPSASLMDVRSKQLKSGPMRSGLIQKSNLLGKSDDEEDDPFKDADIPEDLKNSKLSFFTFCQWIAFVLVMGWLICSLTIPALVKRPIWSMSNWKWALLVFLLFCGRLVSGWVVRILVFVLERNFLMRKRVLYFVYGLRKGVQNCLWLALAVLEWRLVFDPKVERTTNTKVLPYVTKVLNCLLIAAIVWLIKIFFVKVLASSFHVSTYFERIRESLFGQWVLETLAGPPAIEMEQETRLIEEVNDLKKAGAKGPEGIMPKPNARAGQSGMMSLGVSGLLVGGKKSGAMGIGKSGFMGLARVPSEHSTDKKANQSPGITIVDLHRLNPTNISAWNMKRLMNFVRYRGIYTLSHVIDQTAAQSENAGQEMEIHSEWQAIALAKKIFKNVAKPGARYIVCYDLLRFMLQPEVDRAFPLFEGSEETGKISKTALKNFAVHVVRERRALALSLNDTKTAVKKLHRIIDVIVSAIILVVCLLVLGLTTTHLLVVISSQLLLIVFIFGNTCKNVFEAIVFLFIMHPFDVGDRCIVDGNQLVVEEMNILSTLFVRNTGEKIWYPNSLLATKFIFNYHCAPDTGDFFDFSIDASTPSERIFTLKDRIGKYIASKPNLWTRDFDLLVTSIENNNKMNMQLTVNHTINFNDDMERKIRKSELILDVKKILQELEFGYKLLPQEVHLASPVMQERDGNLTHFKCS